jgi:hypothetical protein
MWKGYTPISLFYLPAIVLWFTFDFQFQKIILNKSNNGSSIH